MKLSINNFIEKKKVGQRQVILADGRSVSASLVQQTTTQCLVRIIGDKRFLPTGNSKGLSYFWC